MPTLATADDVLAAIKRFADGCNLATLLTGGWHRERPPASAQLPWAVASCEEGEIIRFSTGKCQTYRVTIEVRTSDGFDTKRDIARNLAQLDRYPFLVLTDTDSRVVHCLRVPGKAGMESAQHRAQDVDVLTDVYDVLVSHPRAEHVIAIGVGTVAIGADTTALGVDP